MNDMLGVDFDQIGAALASGRTLSAGQLRDLAQSRDLIGLGMLAADVRARLHGGRGTFVRVEEIDSATVAQADAADVPADAGEVRLVGVPSSLTEAVAAVRAVRTAACVPVSGWWLHELAAIAGSLSDTLAALRAAGLDAVAMARLDRLDEAGLQAVADAGLVVQVVTLGASVDDDTLLDQLERLRALQAATSVVRTCVPLPVEVSPEHPTTGYDDMRHVAIARLALDNVAHVSAHWTRMGAKLAQSCLLFGADDIDGVPARDDMPHGPRRAVVEEVRRNLVAASLEAVERDGGWQPRQRP